MAEEAYIFGFGIVENYKAVFGMCIAKQSPAYSGFNNFLHGRKLYDPDYTTVVSPNNDTFYSTTWADLSQEPLVIKVPQTGDTYFVIQLVDMFTDNFAYLGTRATGTAGGTYLLVGPDYKGAYPAGRFDKVISSRSRYVALATRTATDGTEEGNKKAFAIQDGLQLSAMSDFLGGPKPKESNFKPDFPVYNADSLYSKPLLFTFLNQFLEWQSPSKEEIGLMKRLAKINVGPYQVFEMSAYSPEVQEAIKEGIKSGHDKIVAKANSLGTREDGWEYIPPMGDYGQNYLFRSAVAYKFIYTNSPEEAIYPIAEADADNESLDGGSSKYLLHFEADQIPPVKAFWSMTIYHSDTRLMVKNPIKRYSIGDRTAGLEYNPDGSLDIYIQHEMPEGDEKSNWLPAPDGPFYIIARMYIPEEAALSGSYKLPAITKNN
ncbi:hypothetical protein GCM10011339_40460 [Echinicola rosea]|uniref:DUF1254 domain-containing protein n=1 Tax=Echinicola rosea TaxID=1807691 RepID=A0ABQ1VA05_9BACT|nr:hypothetical protein GCM10011339_40460 [Echinicola rosea]